MKCTNCQRECPTNTSHEIFGGPPLTICNDCLGSIVAAREVAREIYRLAFEHLGRSTHDTHHLAEALNSEFRIFGIAVKDVFQPETMDGKDKMIGQAKSKLRAAKLRMLAADQDAMAASYLRQAQKPIYDGQELVCEGKAAQVRAMADQNRAEADLIEAA